MPLIPDTIELCAKVDLLEDGLSFENNLVFLRWIQKLEEPPVVAISIGSVGRVKDGDFQRLNVDWFQMSFVLPDGNQALIGLKFHGAPFSAALRQNPCSAANRDLAFAFVDNDELHIELWLHTGPPPQQGAPPPHIKAPLVLKLSYLA